MQKHAKEHRNIFPVTREKMRLFRYAKPGLLLTAQTPVLEVTVTTLEHFQFDAHVFFFILHETLQSISLLHELHADILTEFHRTYSCSLPFRLSPTSMSMSEFLTFARIKSLWRQHLHFSVTLSTRSRFVLFALVELVELQTSS